MNENSDKYEMWGTFSVMDHLRAGAFLAEVIMYDRLVIPIPPDPERAENPEDRVFAEQQWKRWEEVEKWNPKRQKILLDILKPVALPVEWTRQRHLHWAAEYEKGKHNAAQQFSEILAGWKTGEVLLDELPAMARGTVSVSPYNSLEDLKRDFGITETSTAAERLQAGRGLPANVISAVIGHEFLVPEDPDKDEFYLLREAVRMVQEADYRKARADFHNAQQRFIRDGKTDLESITAAVNEMAEHLEALRKVASRGRFWKGWRRGFHFVQILFDLLSAPVNPVAGGRALIALGKFTVDERLGNPAEQNRPQAGGALLLDAQQRLKLEFESQAKG